MKNKRLAKHSPAYWRDLKRRLEEQPNTVLLHAKGFCDTFGIDFEELRQEGLAGRITAVADMRDGGSVWIRSGDALAWLARRETATRH